MLVVNLWATWCAPCKQEMPTLAKLQAAYEGKPVKVVAISIDRPADTQAAKDFIAQNAPLAFYQEASMELPFLFEPEAQGFPTTLLYDKSGMERARVVGEADWSTAEAKAVVDGAPKAVLEGANKETAEKAKAALEEAGASVTLK